MTKVQENLWRRFPRYMAGGMDPNDFHRAVAEAETWDDWLKAVSVLADERIRLAEEALAKGNYLTAGEDFCEAGIYYHFAQLGYFVNDERKLATKLLSIDTYRRGIGHLAPPITRLEIPFDGVRLVANLRMPAARGPFAAIILLPGVDSSKEEYQVFSEVLLHRGMATVALEGPGQGETWFSLKLSDDFERAISATIDHLQGLPSIDPDRIGIYGRSMGGYLAPRAAAFEPRIRAIVSAGGIYDLSYWDNLPEHVQHNFRHAWGYDDFSAAGERARSVSLQGLVGKIGCPMLIVHSGRDGAFPKSGGERMHAEAKCESALVIYDDGTHVCDNIRYKYQRFVADWFTEKLSR